MPSLREVQTAFAAYLRAADPAVLPWIRANGLAAERRLNIYRNNTMLGLTEALVDGFPVVHRLVGAEFFALMARHFVTATPPGSGCLLDYGAAFPDFIEGFEPAAGLPYLPDVARLEWGRHECFHAAAAPIFGTAELVALPSEGQAALRLSLQPGVRLLASRWPVLRIVELHQTDRCDDTRVDLYRETGCRVLIVREGLHVVLHPVSPGEFACLEVLSGSGSLESALAAATTAEPGFDLGAGLTRLMNLKVFCLPPANPTE